MTVTTEVKIPEAAYDWANILASIRGFDSVEELIVNVLLEDLRAAIEADEFKEKLLNGMKESGLFEEFKEHNVDLPPEIRALIEENGDE